MRSGDRCGESQRLSFRESRPQRPKRSAQNTITSTLRPLTRADQSKVATKSWSKRTLELMTSTCGARRERSEVLVRPANHDRFRTRRASDEVGSSCSGANGTTGATETVVAESAGIGIAEYSITATGTKSVDDGELQPPGIAKLRDTEKSELVEFPGELHDRDVPSWSRASGVNCASTTAVVKPVDEVRPLGFVMCGGTSESESDLGESSDEESSDEAQRPECKIMVGCQRCCAVLRGAL